MSSVTNPTSSINYTNKDFRALYEELLDLVKKLSYKWDPSISNESDPGVILLKLDAIIGDKNNYNIDKNILEAFPETLTQEISARNVYKQLAYHMPWYMSGVCNVSMKWNGRELESYESVTIPAFTMLTNSDASIVYTLIEAPVFDVEHSVVSARAIQGTVTDVIVDGDRRLTLSNLDENNRIYLDDYNIAENGVFIMNYNEEGNGTWTAVDNLAVQPRGNRYYEFGVDSRTNICYIEFPEDISDLIHEGLTIKYLISQGRDGNIASKVLDSFYEDSSIAIYPTDEKVTLNDQNILLYNTDASVGGEDPQSIEDAYRGYRRTAGTFETLVTLRDYMNAVYKLGKNNGVSNAVVSDRLNDLQSSHSIVMDLGGVSDLETITQVTDDEVDMTAYDLKLYMLYDPGQVDTLERYDSTFNMVPSKSNISKTIQTLLQEQKCIQHDFVDILPDVPCLFQNAYNVRIKIVPQYKLDTTQINSVKVNIMSALMSSMNAHQIDFGYEPDYDAVYDVISTADERIKTVVLDDFEFTTLAIYWDSDAQDFIRIPVSEFNSSYIVRNDAPATRTAAINYFNSLINMPDSEIRVPDRYYFVWREDVFRYDKQQNSVVLYSDKLKEIRKWIIAKSVLAGNTPLFKFKTTFDCSLDQQVIAQQQDIERLSTELVISPFGFEQSNRILPKSYDGSGPNYTTYQLKPNENLQLLAPSFVTETNYSNYVKYQLILNGYDDVYSYESASYLTYRTGGYAVGTKFYINDITPLETIDYNSYMDITNSMNSTIVEPIRNAYGIPSPMSFAQAWSMGYMSVFIKVPSRTIPANTEYKLRAGESIAFFYQTEDGDDAPFVYRCYKGIDPSQETSLERSPVIRASFTLSGIVDGIPNPNQVKAVEPAYMKNSGTIPYNSSTGSSYMLIKSMYGEQDLSSNKSIDIRKINEKRISANSSYYYFVTNSITEIDGVPNYQMTLPFVSGSDGIHEYTLKSDEYFIYTNQAMSEFEILGPGTLIDLLSDSTSNIVLNVAVVPYQDIATYGITAFSESCKKFLWDVVLREQQIYNFVTNDTIAIEIESDYSQGRYPAFWTNQATVVKDFKISYLTVGSGDSFQYLPEIDIDDDISQWRGTAILNIDCSKDSPQILDNHLSIAEGRSSVQQMVINGVEYPSLQEVTSGTSELYLLSDVSTLRTGGQNIDVTYLDSSGQRMTLEMLLYAQNPAFSNDPFFYDGDTLCLKYINGSTTASNIELQEGYSYILGIDNASAEGSFSISASNATLKCLNAPDDQVTYDNDRTWYFSLTPTASLFSLTFVTSGGQPTDRLIFQHLLKYAPNLIFSTRYGITSNDIHETMNTFSKAEYFKYNNMISDENLIEDPVLAKSFFNNRHVANQYVISYAQLRMSNVDAKDSYITFINNR